MITQRLLRPDLDRTVRRTREKPAFVHVKRIGAVVVALELLDALEVAQIPDKDGLVIRSTKKQSPLKRRHDLPPKTSE